MEGPKCFQIPWYQDHWRVGDACAARWGPGLLVAMFRTSLVPHPDGFIWRKISESVLRISVTEEGALGAGADTDPVTEKTDVFAQGSGGWKSKVQLQSWFPQRPLSLARRWPPSCFSCCLLHAAVPLCVHPWCLPVCQSLLFLSGHLSHWIRAHLTASFYFNHLFKTPSLNTAIF